MNDWVYYKKKKSNLHVFHELCTVLVNIKLICILLWNRWGFLGDQMVMTLPAMQETQVWSLGWEDTLEKGMATHSSTLAWRIPRSENPGGLQSMGLQGVGHDWVTFTFKSSLHILDTSPLPDMWFANIIFPCVISTFISLTLSFTEQKFLILMRSNLSIFFLWHIRFDSTFKNSLPGPQSWRFYFYLFPKHF